MPNLLLRDINGIIHPIAGGYNICNCMCESDVVRPVSQYISWISAQLKQFTTNIIGILKKTAEQGLESNYGINTKFQMKLNC